MTEPPRPRFPFNAFRKFYLCNVLYQGTRLLTTAGHAPAEVAEFASDLKANLAALKLRRAIAASIGDSMIRTAHDYQGDPEAMNVEWRTTARPNIERIAENLDGTCVDWDTIKQGVHAAFNKLPEDFRDEAIWSGALNSAAVVLQLFHAGQRLDYGEDAWRQRP